MLSSSQQVGKAFPLQGGSRWVAARLNGGTFWRVTAIWFSLSLNNSTFKCKGHMFRSSLAIKEKGRILFI